MQLDPAFVRHWRGAGAGPSTLFVHGAGADHTAWSPVVELLPRDGSDLYALDLPGHGRTPGPALETIEQMGQWTAAVIADLGLAGVSVVGHSMGSLVALECAASKPDLFDRIALIATSDRMAVNPSLQLAADNRSPAAVEMILEWSFTGDADPEERRRAVEAARSRLESSLSGSLGADLRACDRYRPTERAGAVRCPALVIGGSHDLMTPAEAGRRLAESFPSAEFALLEGAGHNSLVENPGPTARLLGGFLDS